MITIEQVARRLYFRGNTYPVKDQLSAAGATWDGEQKAWWVGSGKRDLAEKLLAKLSAGGEQAQESISLDARIILGRVQLPGKDGGKPHTYYLLAEGTSKTTGKPYMKLCFRDGSRVFWAKDPSAAHVLARYEEPRSIAALRAFAEKAKSYGTEKCRCSCHTGPGPFGSGGHSLFDGCDRCGCEDDG